MNNVNQGCGCGCTGSTPEIEKPVNVCCPPTNQINVVKPENKDEETACCEPKKLPLWMSVLMYSVIAVAIGIIVYKIIV